MGFPEIGDNSDDVVELLAQIARNTGSLDSGDADDGTVNVFDGSGVSASVGALNPDSYVVKGTDELDGANPDGSITLEPGDDVPLVRHTSPGGLAALAVGATDAANVVYYLYIDGDRTVGGETQSPLGTVNDPFSFPDQFNAVLPAQRRVEYRARYDPDATGTVDLAARLHTEVL